MSKDISEGDRVKFPKIKKGDRFGKLVVQDIGEPRINKDGRKTARWECLCDCGEKTLVITTNLNSGKTKSCGCLVSEVHRKHGQGHPSHRTPEYRAYDNMKSRCYNPNATGYDDYGLLGIEVCDRWLESFENFYEDMGNRPHDSFMLDRIDVYGNYTPENCRWVDRSVSNYNRRKLEKNVSGRTGVYWHEDASLWVVECQREDNRVVKYFKSFDMAVKFRKEIEFELYGEFKPEDREV